jgi:hypothetical protein
MSLTFFSFSGLIGIYLTFESVIPVIIKINPKVINGMTKSIYG